LDFTLENQDGFLINLQPIGKRVRVAVGSTLLEAAQSAGVAIASLCGGIGSCDSCKIRLVTGQLTPPTLEEQATFSLADLQAGYRLACQAQPLTDIILDIPPESLTTPQRLQIEGQGESVTTEPAVTAVDLILPSPGLHDLRDDLSRLRAALEDSAIRLPVQFDYAVLETISETLRQHHWQVRVIMQGDRVIALLPPTDPLLGLAVDVGTTKLAAYLCDLTDGTTLAKSGAMNPQISFGEDVITRISYASSIEKRKTLQSRLVEVLNQMVMELCSQAARDGYNALPEHVVEAVIVGNTAMHHLFAGLPVVQLGAAPYVPAVSESLVLRSADLGLTLAPGAVVYLPPNIAGYVGADHVSMLLATGAWKSSQTLVALDIGTNTEVSLVHDGKLLCCSCASGPAFEGAHIQAGMRAAPGAIERLQISGTEVRLQTIDNQLPVGLCGSGILDAIAAMLDASMLDRRGAIQPSHPLVSRRDGKPEFIIAAPPHTGHGNIVAINRHDVNEIQLAKGAIRAGVEVLMRQAGITADQLESFIVAGAFGTYINLASAVRLGMFPDIPLERFHQVGNAAGAGARQMLLSKHQRRLADEIARRSTYIELAVNPNFTAEYSRALFFPA
jgi:uncharacterized 2Fe-2S/4Fe-4S cluster protein (DUF4445 family)